jgi:hypothetical protein
LHPLTIIKTKASQNSLVMGVKREWIKLKRKPDLMLVLMAVFGMGVAITLILPMAANDTVAAPASELQAGVLIQD